MYVSHLINLLLKDTVHMFCQFQNFFNFSCLPVQLAIQPTASIDWLEIRRHIVRIPVTLNRRHSLNFSIKIIPVPWVIVLQLVVHFLENLPQLNIFEQFHLESH